VVVKKTFTGADRIFMEDPGVSIFFNKGRAKAGFGIASFQII
jgi:hypothetical protein